MWIILPLQFYIRIGKAQRKKWAKPTHNILSLEIWELHIKYGLGLGCPPEASL